MAPASPRTQRDRVSDLQGQVHELTRRLRHTENQAQAHGRMVEEQANAEMMAVLRQEYPMRAQYGAWGHGAQEEIFSLLNSFQASAYRDEQ